MCYLIKLLKLDCICNKNIISIYKICNRNTRIEIRFEKDCKMEIIYDSFFSGSFIDIKGCVQIIRQQDKDFSEKHMNILRYTTKHLNDENTPKAIKSLFAFTG